MALNSLQETYEAKRNEFLGELQKKEEEMRQMFVMRVKEKEAELKEAEKEVSHVSSDEGKTQRPRAVLSTCCIQSIPRAAHKPGQEKGQPVLSPSHRW